MAATADLLTQRQSRPELMNQTSGRGAANAARNARQGLRRATRLVALEPRMLFDGAGADTAAAIPQPDHPASPPDAIPHAAMAPDAASLLVVDRSVDRWQDLSALAAPGTRVLVLDPTRDAIAQIADAAGADAGLSAIHILSHGVPGGLVLNGRTIDRAALAAYGADLARIGQGLTADGDLLLYGCDVADGSAGAAFLDALARATGADVAASTDTTGTGGDWQLEAATGAVRGLFTDDTARLAAVDTVLAAVPSVSVSAARQQVLIGENFDFRVRFDNAGGPETGFGPYIAVFVPAAGRDPDNPSNTAAPVAGQEGITLSGATYLGLPLTMREGTLVAAGGTTAVSFADGGTAPLVAVPAGYGVGDRLYTIQLPFGSFTAGQPAIDIDIRGALGGFADVDVDLPIAIMGGFRFGQDALDNPGTDAPLPGPVSTLTVDPSLYRVTTTYIGPETETATGPNYLRAYRIDVDVAAGQTLTNLALSQILEDEATAQAGLRFVRIDGTPAAIGGTSIGDTPAGGWTNVNGVLVSRPAADTATPATGGVTPVLAAANVAAANGGTVTRTISTITGTAASRDASMVVQFFVPEFDAGSTTDPDRIIDRTSADSTFWAVDTAVSAQWDPTDPDDAAAPVTYDTDVDEPARFAHRLEAEAIAIQKSAAIVEQIAGGTAQPTPGDIVEYTLGFQISDYFAFEDVVVSDMLSDGQTLLQLGALAGQFTPTLVVNYDNAAGARVSRTLEFTPAFFTSVSAAAGATGFGTPASTAFFDANGAFQNVRANETRTFVRFDVAGLLQANGLDTRMAGDLFGPSDASGAATGTIRFRTVIDQAYTDRVEAPGANRDLNVGDTIENAATVDGSNLETTFAPTGAREFDDSAAALGIAPDQVDLSIYARNGNTDNTDGRLSRVVPGDTITYRVRYTVPTGDYDNFSLSAFLPLPTLSTTDFDANGATDADLVAGGGLNNFTRAPTSNAPSAAVPGQGQFSYGPDHFGGIVVGNDPASPDPSRFVETDANSNGIRFDLGTRNDASPAPRQIDLLFTVRASDRPFAADGFFLTALAEHADQSTPGAPVATQDIDAITLTQPRVAIRKGVVRDAESATHSFGPFFRTDDTSTVVAETALVAAAGGAGNALATPVTGANAAQLDTDLFHVDGGDTVRHALVVSNTGAGDAGAFDIRVRDELPFGLAPADVTNIVITRGGSTTPIDISAGNVVIDAKTGTPISTQAQLAAALFGGNGIDNGIEFVDTPTAGFLGRGVDGAGAVVTDGSNLVVITYDVVVPTTLEAGTFAETRASLLSYSGREGGAGTLEAPAVGDYTQLADGAVDGILREEATITVAETLVDKTLEGTSDDSDPAAPVFAANGDAVIGEQARYRVVLTLPEGRSSGAIFSDTLAEGMAFVAVESVTIGAGLTSSLGSGAALLAGVNFSAGARTFTLALGDLVNTDTANAAAQTITIEYRAVVLNTTPNQADETRTNTATFSSNGGAVTVLDTAVVTLREPVVTIAVTPDDPVVDAGDVVRFTVSVENTGTQDAFDVALRNFDMPPGLVYVPGSWTQTAGTPFTLDPAFDANIGAGAAPAAARLDRGQTATFTFQAAVPLLISAGDSPAVRGTVRFSSLPGTANTDLSPRVDTGDGERDGTDGTGGVNDYVATGIGSVTVPIDAPLLRIVGSSEAATTPAPEAVESSDNPRTDTLVAVGEIVRYRMIVQLPESTTLDVRLTPRIPPGLQFLNDGTSTIGFVSDGGLGSSAVPGAALSDAAFGGGAPTTAAQVATASPTVVVAPARIDFAGGPGTDPTFRIGDITNADSDADSEFVVIEFNALVTNESFNQSGRVIGDGMADPDTADPEFNFVVTRDVGGVETVLRTSNVVTETLVEPSIVNLAKRVVASDGATVTYEVTFSNTGGTTAHGVRFTDEFAGLPGLAFGGAGTVAPTTAGGTSAVRNVSDADTAALEIDSIPVGGSVTVRYTATAAPGVTHAGNPAVVTFTSVDVTPAETAAGGEQFTFGALTSTGGAAGSTTGTRTGADGLPASDAAADRTGPLNNQRDQDTAGLGVIRGTLWDDTADQDGVVDAGEARLGGQTVTLRWFGIDGIPDNGDDTVHTTTTDPDGNFVFSARPPGNYRIVAPASAAVVNGGDADTITPRFDVSGSQTDAVVEVVVGDGVEVAGQNIGYVQPNDAPVLAGLDPVSPTPFREADGPTLIDANVTVSDPEMDRGADSWNEATLTVARQGGANAADQLGSALVVGSNVVVNGVTIGTVDTSTPGRLAVVFNGNATTPSVQQFLQSLTYANASDTPPTGVTLDYVLTDGNAGPQGTGGVLSTTQSVRVPIVAVNDAPVIAGLDPLRATPFAEGGPAVPIDTDIVLSDAEIDAVLDDWNSGRLVVAREGGAVASDVISSPLLVGNDIVVAGVVIGTADTSVPGRLTATFNAAATSTSITAFARSLTYANTAVAPPAEVALRYDLFDGNAGALPQGERPDLATTATSRVPIGALDNPPTAANAALTVNAGSSGNPIPLTALVADPDTPTDRLTITIDRVPDPVARGVLRLADGTLVTPGAVLTVAQFQGMRFTPSAALVAEPGTTARLPAGSLGYTVRDPSGGSATGTVAFDVLSTTPLPFVPIPDAPPVLPAFPFISPAPPVDPGAGGGATVRPLDPILPSGAALVAPVVPGGGGLAPQLAANDQRVATLTDRAALDGNGFFDPVRIAAASGPERFDAPLAATAVAAAGGITVPEQPLSAVVGDEAAAAETAVPAAAGAVVESADAASAFAESADAESAAAPSAAVATASVAKPAATTYAPAAGKPLVDCGAPKPKPVKLRVSRPHATLAVARDPAVPAAKVSEKAARAFSEMVQEAKDKDRAKPKVKLKPKARAAARPDC
jgi:large repetitive protein